MGFSCTIIAKNGEITGFDETHKMHYKCQDLNYNDSPYQLMELRQELCWYPEITGTHAQYVFSAFQQKVIANIVALNERQHPECPHCECRDERKPTEGMLIVANINPLDIISISGGY